MIQKKQQWVIKIGSSLITEKGRGLRHEQLEKLCQEIVFLRSKNIDVVLVSSGAVAQGIERLGLVNQPINEPTRRAAAAVGQMGLIEHYETLFIKDNIQCAQLLLTHADLQQRERYLNAQSTLKTLLNLKVLPIVNENDSIVVDAIRFGDNDQLAGLMCNLIDAEKLILLTDQDGLYTADPSQDSKAQKIHKNDVNDPWLLEIAGGKSSSGIGTGGMYSKILAARLAARSGCETYITSGKAKNPILDIYHQESQGTCLKPTYGIMPAKKRWLAGQLKTKGHITIDQGAEKKLLNEGASLLAVGILEVDGEFHRGDAVECLNTQGQAIAVGLTHYSSYEIRKIKGLATGQIPKVLDYEAEPSVIHRDNLAKL